MKLETKIKQVLVALLGNTILGFGVGMTTIARLGADPVVSFSRAACIKLGITMGQMTTITNVVLLIIVFIVKKKNIGLATLFVALLNQYPIDFIVNLIPYVDSLWINILWVLAGILCVSIGCTIIMASDLGLGIYDAFVYGIADRFNKSFLFVRYTVDSIFFVLTIILGGYIGIGTILCYVLLGKTINTIRPTMIKIFKIK